MQREIDERLIRPEKLMKARDMAKVGCNGCKDCAYCCENRATVIVLDEWDVRELKKGLGLSFSELLSNGLVTLSVIDGVVLPGLGVKEGTESCVFLNEEKRCQIHGFRPGICRLFPLARLYHEDGSFSYFLQEGECVKPTGVKVRIDRWLGIPDVRGYEEAVRAYHEALMKLREACAAPDLSDEERTKLQTAFLEEHFFRD